MPLFNNLYDLEAPNTIHRHLMRPSPITIPAVCACKDSRVNDSREGIGRAASRTRRPASLRNSYLIFRPDHENQALLDHPILQCSWIDYTVFPFGRIALRIVDISNGAALPFPMMAYGRPNEGLKAFSTFGDNPRGGKTAEELPAEGLNEGILIRADGVFREA